MRLAILMWLGSSWSRDAALQLAHMGHDIHVVDFAVRNRTPSHLDSYGSQSSEITFFCKSVAAFHLVEASLSFGLRYFEAARKLREILHGCGAELLLTLYAGGFATIAYLSRFRPYVVYAVGSDILEGQALKRGITRLALTAAASVFANGQYLAKRTREVAPAAQVFPLYLGVDTDRFTPGLPPLDPINIICARPFQPIYNNEYLLHGLAVMPELPVNFRIIFVSSGPLLDRVRALAHKLLPERILRNVTFLGGVSNEKLLRTLKHSHIYVSLSRSDGTSTSLLEALACGLYPVLSDIPQNREWVRAETNNGLLVPLDQPKKLAEALSRAIVDPDGRSRAAAYNRALVTKRARSCENMAILGSRLKSLTCAYAHGN